MIKEDGFKNEYNFEFLETVNGLRTADVIRDHLMMWTKDKYIDFIYIGNKGADFSNRQSSSKYLGSVTAEVIRHTKLNCFFIP